MARNAYQYDTNPRKIKQKNKFLGKIEEKKCKTKSCK